MAAPPAAAEAPPDPLSIPVGVEQVALTPHLGHWTDPSGLWQPGPGSSIGAEAAEAADAPGFRPVPRGGNLGAADGVHWFRLVVGPVAEGPLQWVLSVDNPQIERLQVWVISPSRRVDRHELGTWRSVTMGDTTARIPHAALTLDRDGATTVYLRVVTSGKLQVTPFLRTPSAWQRRDSLAWLGFGLYFGLVLGLGLYNLLIGLGTRTGVHLHYAAFVLAQAGFQLASIGAGRLFLWHPWPWINAAMVNALAFATTATALLFSSRFIRLDEGSPRLMVAMNALAALWAGTIALGFLFDARPLVNWLVTPLVVLTCVVTVASLWHAAQRAVPGFRVFAVAWTGVVAAFAVKLLQRWGLLAPAWWVDHAVMLATAFEAVLLSLALAVRIRAERRSHAGLLAQRQRDEALKEAAEAALRDRTRFMAAISHDLRQPLYALGLATHTLERMRGMGDAAVPLQQVRSALVAADHLVSSMAVAVQLDTARLQPDRVAFCLQPLFERIESLFEPIANERGLRWRVTPSIDWVDSDPDLLERMVSNLVANAFRFTDRGGVMLSARRRQDHLLIQVWDTGRGIDEDEQAIIFGDHVRGRSSRDGDGGIGLGLSIVHRCAGLLGIAVGLRSVRARGSCFSLRVPIAAARDESASRGDCPDDPIAGGMRPIR